MARTWDLQHADDEHLRVLAECWGVHPASVTDRSTIWVQQERPGDAPGPRIVQLCDRRLTVLEAPGRLSATWLHRMVGLRGLLRVPDAPQPTGVRVLGPDDQVEAVALQARVSNDDLAAASPSPADSLLAVGDFDGADLVAVAAVVQTPCGPPEVSILVDPRVRGRGTAARLERSLVSAAAGRWEWLQHRTVQGDTASQALAASVGFRLVSVEHLLRPTSRPDE